MHKKRGKKLSILTQMLRGVLVAILLGLAVVLLLSIFDRPHIRQDVVSTLDDANRLAQAIEHLETEYEKHPDTPSLDFETEGPDAVKLITVLLGNEDSAPDMQNPRQLMFLTIRISKNKRRSGLVLSPDEKPKGIYDAWGHPLRVILRPPDQSTLRVAHAGKQVTTSTPAVVLSRGPDALVLSRGRDGIEGTSDDIQSWKFKR